MTTYKYSVPWLELECALAAVLPYEEWAAIAAKIGTPIPEVDLPESIAGPPVRLHAGVVGAGPAASARYVYRGLKASRRPPASRAKRALKGVAALVADTPGVTCDLAGVHLAYQELARWAAEHRTAYATREAEWAVKVATATYYSQVVNTKMDPVISMAKANLTETVAPGIVAEFLQVVEAIKVLKHLRHSAKAKRLVMRYGSDIDDAARRRTRAGIRATCRTILPATFPTAEAWAGRIMLKCGTRHAVLSTGDLQRLEQYACGLMNMAVAQYFEGCLRLVDKGDAVAWIKRSALAMSAASVEAGRGNEVHVVRAYKQAYAVALASKCGLKAGHAAQLEELEAMPFAAASGALAHAAELSAMKIQQIVDLGKVHKVLPPGSSLGAATAYARFLKARQENAKRAVAPGRPALDEQLVAKCLRDEVARALRNRHEALALQLKDALHPPDWYAAWRDKRIVPQAPGWSEALDLRASVRVPARSDFSPGAFKDSALAPDELPRTANDFKPKEHTNMALRRFVDPDYPTVKAAAASLTIPRERWAKGDQKPENYKDPLRLFYEAQLVDRMGVSWSEAAIYSVAKHHPCYMLGRKPVDVQRRAREMVSPPEAGFSKRMFSFDVSNWSAGMAAKIQRESGALWAEVFDDPAIGSAYAAMADTTVYVQKHGFIGSYESPTANFEGYDGKAMTMVHIALMAATVHRTRAITGTADLEAELMAYIDDGAAVLTLPSNQVGAVFEEFMTCAEEVYGAERFVLHATKCMPSDRMFVFLNEVYYAGAHVVSNTKAATKIASEPKQEHDSLPDRIMMLTSGAQGAVQAGMNPCVGAMFCYFLCALELREWAGRAVDLKAIAPSVIALFLVSPAAYLGLAVPSAVGLGKTGRGASLSEGIAAMQSAAAGYPGLAPMVISRLRKPLPARSAVAILRNPTGTSGHSVLRTNRVATAVSERLLEVTQNPTALQVLAPLRDDGLEAYAAAFLASSATLSATAIQMAWRAHPASLAEAWVAKFESSKTIAQLLGPYVFKGITRAHREDAVRAMKVAFAIPY